ncbi:MAG: alpha/beta hydrolase [Ruminococcaceae bacterium]|nr:alpha/beta hydrolase [Oscillospiraceae bacterium]
MNKKLIGALVAIGGAAAVAEFAIHGYLDVMYAERIPQGIMKRLGNKKSDKSLREIHKFNAGENEWVSSKDIEIIDMKNNRDNNLKGYFLASEEESDVFVLFAHGYRSSHCGDPYNFIRFYHEEMKYNFMSVDHVTAGDSDGDYLGFDYFESEDMLLWLDYLVERFGKDIKIILHGVSMGGATVCKMASRVPEQVKLIVSDCAYTSAEDQLISVCNSVGLVKSAPLAFYLFNRMNKRLAKFDLKDTNVRDSVAEAKVPMLFVHGDADDFVPTRMAFELYDACGSEKDLLIVNGAAHAESILIGSEKYKAKLKEFIGKYL